MNYFRRISKRYWHIGHDAIDKSTGLVLGFLSLVILVITVPITSNFVDYISTWYKAGSFALHMQSPYTETIMTFYKSADTNGYLYIYPPPIFNNDRAFIYISHRNCITNMVSTEYRSSSVYCHRNVKIYSCLSTNIYKFWSQYCSNGRFFTIETCSDCWTS